VRHSPEKLAGVILACYEQACARPTTIAAR
jgi:hypothetical protein